MIEILPCLVNLKFVFYEVVKASSRLLSSADTGYNQAKYAGKVFGYVGDNLTWEYRQKNNGKLGYAK